MAQTFLHGCVLRCWIPISKIEMLNKISLLYNLGAASGTLGFIFELLVAIMIFFLLFAIFSLVFRVYGYVYNSDFELRFAFVS